MYEEAERRLHNEAHKAAGGHVVYNGFLVVRLSAEVSWKGFVNIYTSRNGLVFAWIGRNKEPMTYFAVVKSAVIESPQAAVQAWLDRTSP